MVPYLLFSHVCLLEKCNSSTRLRLPTFLQLNENYRALDISPFKKVPVMTGRLFS